MQGKATIAGHPIHPMLVAFPIGFFAGAVISDIITLAGHPDFWPRMSVALIGFGIIAALLAAVFGFVDYFTAPMPPPAKKTATTHMIINLIVVVVYVIAFFLRMANPVSALGYVLTFGGLVLLVVSGWYGGHLAYVGLVGTQSSSEGSSSVRR
jgi:uncharacterized membrane protein